MPQPTKAKAKEPAEPDVPETKKDTKASTKQKPVRAKAKKPAEQDVPETKEDTKAGTTPTPVEAAGKQVKKEPPAVVPAEQTAPDKAPSAQSAPVVPEPTKPGTAKTAASPVTTASPETTEITGEEQVDSPPAHVIAATSTAPGRRHSIRPFLLTGIIVLAGVLGARAWFSNNNTTDIAAIQDSAETEQVSPVTAKPPIEEVSKVVSEPTVKPAAAATQTNSWAPTVHPARSKPAGTREALPTVAATPPAPPADDVVVTEPPQQQAKPQTTAAAPQATSPVAPKPAYYAPAYGYYPRQPVQQQFYRPAYPRPSYSQ
jgi:hypothetical protein